MVVILAAALVAGCSSADGGADSGEIHFTPLERDESAVESVSAPEPPVDLEARPEYGQIIDGFRAKALVLFRRDDVTERLDQIERVFVGTGKYLQLVAIYQEVVDELGLDNAAAPRLARAYIRLGQRRQARQLLDRLAEARGEDATVAFLEGFYALSAPEASQEGAQEAASAWRRALEIDPDFEGPGGMGAEALRRRIEQLEQQGASGGEGGRAGAEGPVAEAGSEAAGGAESAEGGEPADGGGEAPSESEEADGAAETAGDDEAGDERELAEAGGESGSDEAGDEEPETGESGGDEAGGEEPEAGEEGAEADEESGPPPVGVVVMRADQARDAGDLEEAAGLYDEALERRPDHLDAQIGRIRLDHRREVGAEELAGRLEELLEHPDLGARDAYELGLFAETKLGRPELAESFRERVRELDADYADQLGISE